MTRAIRFGPFVLHRDRRRLIRDGTEIHLTPKAFELLVLLVARAPAVVSKAEIHAHLWPATFVADTTLVGVMKELRRALGGADDAPLIRTVHRVGYAFDEAVVADMPDQAAAATHWLVVGDRRIALRKGVNLIGRDPAASVWLDVPGVSRRHAHIVLEDGLAVLEDLGSKNGTLLGGRRVEGRVTLRDSDRIEIATEVLVVHESGSGMSTITQ
jgi:DNA-binding winged helix-turn-helix (wHTH) protein